jgi:hypothetical protein
MQIPKGPIRAEAAIILFFFAGTLLNFVTATAQHLPSQDPGHKGYAKINGVKFSVPNSFNIEPSPDPHISFMRHSEYGLGLFVAVTEKQVDKAYLINLSDTLASNSLPSQKGFEWKVLPDKSGQKVSKVQTSGGNTKGYNKKTFLQMNYIVLATQNQTVVVGYMTTIGKEANAKFLFDLDGPGVLSMPGWYAQAHIIASITGERYEEINPGTYFKAVPSTKKN